MNLEQGANSSAVSTEPPVLTLLPAAIDPATFKTQMTIAAAVGIVAVFAAYWGTLFIGFLPSDGAVVEGIATAARSTWLAFPAAFLAAIGHNPDYGRLAAYSLAKDFLFWHANAFGYHLTNLLILSASAVLVGQITSQICRRWGNRLNGAPAVWASLLFAVNPLNSTLIPYLTARMDLMFQICTLATVFFYLRLRALRERGYLWLAMATFGMALLTTPAAVMIPFVVTAAEFLNIGQLPVPAGLPAEKRPALAQRLLLVGFFWLEFFFVLTLSIVAPNAIPLSRLDLNFGSWLNNFRSLPLWENLFVPSMGAADKFVIAGVAVALVWAVISLIIRAISKSVSGRSLLWLSFWSALSMVPINWLLQLPQNQALWMPNASGPAAVIAQAAAPLSILLTLTLLPALGTVSKRLAKPLAVVGMVALAMLVGAYSAIDRHNIKPLEQSGELLHAALSSLSRIALQTDKQVIVASLPPQINDASPIPPGESYQEYGSKIVAPPFVIAQLKDRVSIAGLEGKYVWPQRFYQLATGNDHDVLVWNDSTRSFEKWEQPTTGDDRYEYPINESTFRDLTINPPEALRESKDKLKMLTEHASAITPLANGIRIVPGKHRITLWLPATDINPSKADVAGLLLLYTSPTGCHTCNGPQLKLIWQAESADTTAGSGRQPQQSGQAVINDITFKQYLVWLGRYPQWTLAKKITRLGFAFEPGDYYVDIGRLSLLNHNMVMPKLALRVNGNIVQSASPIVLQASNKAEILFDAEPVPAVAGTKVTISSTGASFTSDNDEGLYKLGPTSGTEISNQDYAQTKGAIALPAELFKQPGVHYIRAMALDRRDSQIGLPTEPMAIDVQ